MNELIAQELLNIYQDEQKIILSIIKDKGFITKNDFKECSWPFKNFEKVLSAMVFLELRANNNILPKLWKLTKLSIKKLFFKINTSKRFIISN